MINKLPDGESAKRMLLRRYKYEAKRLKLEFLLSESEFFSSVKTDCSFCGCSPRSVSKHPHANGVYMYNGLYRLDRSEGYTFDNVVPCCWLCSNRRKSKKLPLGASALNTLYIQYKWRAANTYNLEFSLSKDLFAKLTSSSCYYCGIGPSMTMYYKKNMNGPYQYNGLDRVDNKLGYMEHNVVPCCSVCNKAKRDMLLDQFYEWVDRLAVHQWYQQRIAS